MAIGLADVVEMVRKPNADSKTNNVIPAPSAINSPVSPSQPPSTPPRQSTSQSPDGGLPNGSNGEPATNGIEETPFRGAFSTEDTQRGAVNLLRQEKEESASLASKSVRNGKAREISEDAGTGEELDIAEEMPQDAGLKGKMGKRPATTKKSSMWGTYRRGRNGDAQHAYQDELNATASSSEDEEVEQNGNATPMPKSSRPRIKRATTGWNALREKIKGGTRNKVEANELNEALEGHQLTTELALGTLPMVILKMGILDRDEHGAPRIPILLNFIKVRMSNEADKSDKGYRIDLEYGDGLLKWTIHRDVRDFLNLHAHFRLSNLRHGISAFPTFPRTTYTHLPWMKLEKRGKANFARLQRQNLESYLLKLIRATMFGAGANRLSKFLEISSMGIVLAKNGGTQGKQGYLRVMSSAVSRKSNQGFHPFQFAEKHEPKWFLVRESYLVAVEDPASTEIFDVFLIDSSFKLQRTKRLLRQGMHLFSHTTDPADEMLQDASLINTEAAPAAPTKPEQFKDASNHTFALVSSERRLKLVAKTERQQEQFISSIEQVVAKCIFAGRNRFDSFAPLRLNASCQWLVDGRDYFWALSRAILLAKETIYIHDWWLSPELYLRRPPAENEEWRLDRLLKRKAEEGVKIFVIIYREVSNDFTPVDSTHTKTSLRALHPNIFVQRSPNHSTTGTILWSHHEKMCVVDETIAFAGGFDLCFGRWDTPAHPLIDDDASPEFPTIFPGKDYANSRVLDFKELDKPFEDLFARDKVPRQPWHDVGLQIIGQPARDLSRHYIQRWNMLLRTKNHTVQMPFLLPSPDFTPAQLQALRITGTCEVQICRSIGPWSMGVGHVENSIQTAYIKAISLSEHFVYIENQFFITSTIVEGTEITNKIGDALVSRIVQAHDEGTEWRAVIVIPLVPGYTFPIDHESAGSVRMIMNCQNMSISHGENSIFARLRREGINPDDYITFYSLRGCGKFTSTGALTTEAVYIHAKTFVADDRLVIIGSANINERSMRGDRDSELAVVIRDMDMIDSTMGGQPFQVGRFAHTLRVRLMKEHVGLDVEEVDEPDEKDVNVDAKADDALSTHPPASANSGSSPPIAPPSAAWDPDHEQTTGAKPGEVSTKASQAGWIGRIAEGVVEHAGSMGSGLAGAAGLGLTKGQDRIGKVVDRATDNIAGATNEEKLANEESPAQRVIDGKDKMTGYASTVVPTFEETEMMKRENDGAKVSDTRQIPVADDVGVDIGGKKLKPVAPAVDKDDAGRSRINTRPLPSPESGANELAATKNVVSESLRRNLKESSGAFTIPLPTVEIDPKGLADPLLFHDTFMATAVRNTQVYRKVFRCVPDDLVQTWGQYREYQTWADRHNKPPRDVVPKGKDSPVFDESSHSGQHGSGGGGTGGGSMGQGLEGGEDAGGKPAPRARSASIGDLLRGSVAERRSASGTAPPPDARVPHDHEVGFPEHERDQMEEALLGLQGHLVVYPTRFLEVESVGGNFLFSRDRIPPIAIYD